MAEKIENFLKSCSDFKAENGGFDRIIAQSAEYIPNYATVLADELQVFPATVNRWAAGKSIPNHFAQKGIVATVAEMVGRQLEHERNDLKADGVTSDLERPREQGLEP